MAASSPSRLNAWSQCDDTAAAAHDACSSAHLNGAAALHTALHALHALWPWHAARLPHCSRSLPALPPQPAAVATTVWQWHHLPPQCRRPATWAPGTCPPVHSPPASRDLPSARVPATCPPPQLPATCQTQTPQCGSGSAPAARHPPPGPGPPKGARTTWHLPSGPQWPPVAQCPLPTCPPRATTAHHLWACGSVAALWPSTVTVHLPATCQTRRRRHWAGTCPRCPHCPPVTGLPRRTGHEAHARPAPTYPRLPRRPAPTPAAAAARCHRAAVPPHRWVTCQVTHRPCPPAARGPPRVKLGGADSTSVSTTLVLLQWHGSDDHAIVGEHVHLQQHVLVISLSVFLLRQVQLDCPFIFIFCVQVTPSSVHP